MAPEKPLVYLLHGLLETAYGHFGPQIRTWADRYRVVPLDLPGHGRCPVDVAGPLSEANRRYVTSVLRSTGPGRVVAASYLGGPVAVRCAVQEPALVRSLVLTGLVPDVPQAVFQGWTSSISSVADRSAEMAQAYERVHGARWRRTLALFEQDVRDRYTDSVLVTRQMVADVPCPVLIVNGAAKTAEREAAATAAEIGPRVRGRVIEGAGHIPGRDRPEEFDAAVAGFWSGEETA